MLIVLDVPEKIVKFAIQPNTSEQRILKQTLEHTLLKWLKSGYESALKSQLALSEREGLRRNHLPSRTPSSFPPTSKRKKTETTYTPYKPLPGQGPDIKIIAPDKPEPKFIAGRIPPGGFPGKGRLR